MSQLLYGYNNDERIVAVHHHDDSTMRVYFREPTGIRHEDQDFFPFFHLADETLLQDFPKKHWVKRLSGAGHFQYLCVFEEWSVLWEALRFTLDRYNRTALKKATGYQDLEQIYLFPDPVTHYLLQTGRTLFKGMQFEDLRRLQLDIETYTSPPHRFSNASRKGDRIILIALSDNRDWHTVIDGRKLTEPEMLRELVRLISEQDPDVIEGHNILGFDLPYIIKRAELHNVGLEIGRGGAPLRSFENRILPSERSFSYAVTEVPGRHIVDTLMLVQSYDMGKRDMESYGLKYAAHYLGVAMPNRTYIPGEKISWYWDHEPETLMHYALDDVLETRNLSSLLSHSSFYLTQMLPFNYAHVVRLGSAAKIESLMVREYVREKHALPKPQQGSQTTGGYTDVYTTGILGPIIQVDIESLYPSVMITNNIVPASDVKGVFLELLKTLTAMRLDTKRGMLRADTSHDRDRLDALQSSLKILINSFYGYLGYTKGLFNDFAQADVVTKTGQGLLRQMIGHIQGAGGKVIEVDTDGVFFVPPPDAESEEEQNRFVAELAGSMPDGITVHLEGRYQLMLSYKKKNYALLDDKNRIHVKGSSLTSRAMEGFGRGYILKAIACILHHDVECLHRAYAELYRRISEHKLDAKDFVRVETLRDSLTEYSTGVQLGKRTRSAAYEVALSLERPFRPGDRVAYYVTGTDPNPRTFEHCKAAEAWDPNFPDENVAYYLRRLGEFCEKFRPYFTPQDYHAIFSADDLFAFSPEGIEILTADVGGKDTPGGEEALPSDFTIWLDE